MSEYGNVETGIRDLIKGGFRVSFEMDESGRARATVTPTNGERWKWVNEGCATIADAIGPAVILKNAVLGQFSMKENHE